MYVRATLEDIELSIFMKMNPAMSLPKSSVVEDPLFIEAFLDPPSTRFGVLFAVLLTLWIVAGRLFGYKKLEYAESMAPQPRRQKRKRHYNEQAIWLQTPR